ncbi:uncharacterized protein LOC123547568 isoform X2 [Mercenaria mercenaria]|nr:uncharacterized protein LOC123547568 isoform X2 [Mercenaria mercenaria]XP_053407805.1 uncharacterized protein LOC123547568 isoform X2 [Mercenaria mercenaria]
MMAFSLAFVVYFMGFVSAVVSDTCRESAKDIVTLRDLEEKVDRRDWIQIYVSEFDPQQNYGKCNVRWNEPDSNNIIYRQLVCYNFRFKDCEDFGRAVKRSVDECGRAEENGENTTMDAKFYSQDATQYLWYDQCYEYDAFGACAVRYLDLLVKASRIVYTKKQELDLFQLPWHLIAEDLNTNFDLDMSDFLLKFTWIDRECGYDGKGRPVSATFGDDKKRNKISKPKGPKRTY